MTKLKQYNNLASTELFKFGTEIKIPIELFKRLEKKYDERVTVFPFTDINSFWGEQVPRNT